MVPIGGGRHHYCVLGRVRSRVVDVIVVVVVVVKGWIVVESRNSSGGREGLAAKTEWGALHG